MYDYTSKFKQECKRYKMEGNERAIADLILLGWNPRDAYVAVGLNSHTYSETFHEESLKRIMGSDEFVTYSKKTERKMEIELEKKIKSRIGGDEEIDEDDNAGKYRTKEEVLDALIAELPNVRGKDRVDVLMKIADLQRMKQEEIVEEDNTVHYYVPIQCHICDLYNKEKKRLEKLKRKATNESEEEDD